MIETIIEKTKQTVEDSINTFWHEMRLRTVYADLTVGPTSFSEALPELVISILDRSLSGRKSLSHEHEIVLLRVTLRGSVIAIKVSVAL